jgi:hypothetical protein
MKRFDRFDFNVLFIDAKGRPGMTRRRLVANTRSEARALLKAELGISRKGRLLIGT